MTACSVCARDLPDDTPQTCVRCVGRVRTDLATLMDLVALGHDRLDGWPPRSAGTPSDASRSAEEPLPGGELLVMLAGGSWGGFWAAGDWQGKTPVNDNLPSDPPSVEWLLTYWEDTIREHRDLRSAQPDRDGPLMAAYLFLDHYHSWAAQNHPLFAEYASDLRKARTMLETQLRAGNRSERGVPCLDCGTQLVRHYANPDRCPPIWIEPTDTTPGHTAPCPHETGGGHDQGGLRDHWQCPDPDCRRRYDHEEYVRAVWQTWEDQKQEDAS